MVMPKCLNHGNGIYLSDDEIQFVKSYEHVYRPNHIRVEDPGQMMKHGLPLP